METIFMNTENSKINEPHKFVLNLSQLLDLRVRINLLLIKIDLFITRDLFIYKNNKLKIIAPTWNDESELPDGSYSM